MSDLIDSVSDAEEAAKAASSTTASIVRHEVAYKREIEALKVATWSHRVLPVLIHV